MKRYRKPNAWGTRTWGASVIGEPLFLDDKIFRRNNTAQRYAKKLRKNPTAAEARLEEILNELNGGVLQGKFFVQWPFADRWILDFFFYKNRLGIEVDGSVHNNPSQIRRDKEKERICLEWDITLIRIKNQDVFGERELLLKKIRDGWRAADSRIEGSPFAMRN